MTKACAASQTKPYVVICERQKSWFVLIIFWLALLLLAGLRPLAVPDEGRYGEIGRWMLLSGDWLTPRLNGLPFFHKPPLLYWMDAVSLAVFGINEWALRLVPALHAGLMLLGLYLGVRSVSGELTARRSVVMLASGLGFLIGGQYVNHDMLVATWISLAIWAFAFALAGANQPNPNLARLGFVACALGVLSKGLIGVVLPGLVLFIWLLWTRQFKKVLHLPWLSGLALFLALALPWFVLAQQEHANFFNYMFIDQQFGRYVGAVYNNARPWWFYLLALLLLLCPWLFFALSQWRRLAPDNTPLPLLWWRLCWAWLLAIVLFFSIPSSKLVGYIMPVLPPLAWLASVGWQRVMAKRAWAPKLLVGVVLFNVGLALVLVFKVGAITQVARSQDAASVLAQAARASDRVYVAGDYPYDLPFYAGLRRPMLVLADWPRLRQSAGDNWQRELFEGAAFDADAAQVLQPLGALLPAGRACGNWLVIHRANQLAQGVPGWVLFYQGAGWDLYRSGGGTCAQANAEKPIGG